MKDFLSEANIENTKFLLKDLLYGDMNVAEREDYLTLTGQELQRALQLIVNNEKLSESEKKFFIENSWRIHYEVKPPTVQEFLTPKWIGAIADQVYDHVREVFNAFLHPYSNKRVLALTTAIGWGKAQPLDSLVQLKNGGTKPMRDIQVGDELAHPYNKESKVIAIPFKDKIDVYEITFKDGTKTRCSREHLWKISERYVKEKGLNKREFRIRSLDSILNTNLETRNGGVRYWIPSTNPVEYKERKHLIHPYNLGVLIGDGVIIRNKYKEEIKRLGLNCTSSFKFIPEEYLFDSIENRIKLLQGLMDTDGWVEKTGRCLFSTSFIQLKQDVKTLCQSLGAIVLEQEHKVKGKRTNGEAYYPSYRLVIKLPDYFSPFKLQRKKDRWQEAIDKRHSSLNKGIKDIKYIGQEEGQCITVSADDGLYLTNDYIVTHNSSISTLIILYIIVHIQYMRNPKEFFGLNEMGSIVVALLSFTMKKANQILLNPFANALRSSPMFERVRQEDRLEKKQMEIGKEHIAYTSAGRMGAFQFSKDIHITIMSDRSALLGMNIIAGVASEISFWIEKGVNVEEIWGTFSDLRERINSRFHHRYLTATILDSSPLDLSLSPIDKWLYTPGQADADPEVMIVNQKHWEVFPERYPLWKTTGKTFPVYRGSAAKPPKIITPNEVDSYGKEEVFNVPIDVELAFQNNTKKMVADYAAWPAGGISKLIDNFDYIENLFDDRLVNIYTSISVPSTSSPEKLIWNQIKDTFFIKTGSGYEFYRAPRALRSIHIDLAESGDMGSIGMTHFESGSKTGNLYLVNDFVIPLSPEKAKINLDSVASFMLDLKTIGHIRIYKITADQYQSSALLQRLDRLGLNVARLSVDRETAPYRVLSSWIYSERIKAGKNIFLKNNLKSLIEVRKDSGKVKIDHSKGKIVYSDDANWETSSMGINAKDVSDSFTGSAYTLIIEQKDITPHYIWDEDYHEDKTDGISGKFEDNIKSIFEGGKIKDVTSQKIDYIL